MGDGSLKARNKTKEGINGCNFHVLSTVIISDEIQHDGEHYVCLCFGYEK